MNRSDVPCCDDVRKLRCVGGNLHCDWLKEHQLLVDTDGVGTGRHVLQPERTVLLADDCEDAAESKTSVNARSRGTVSHLSSSGVLTSDLVAEGHRGVRHALPADAVENSACDGEAHDSEDGLDVEQQKTA